MTVPWKSLKQAVIDGETDIAVAEARRGLEAGVPAEELFYHAIVAGIQETGRRWNANKYAVPDVVLSADAFRAAVGVVEEHLSGTISGRRGKVLVGVVEGDIHDLGKSIVVAMLQGAGFQVIDLGVDVPTEQFVGAVRAESPDIVGIGAYLSTTMLKIGDVIEALVEAGLRSQVKVMIGGVPVTQRFAEYVGADAWGADASVAVAHARRFRRTRHGEATGPDSG